MEARSNVVAILVLYKSGISTIIYRQLIKHPTVSLLLGHKKKKSLEHKIYIFFLAHGLHMIWNVNLFSN
jgi:hypothetical protein